VPVSVPAFVVDSINPPAATRHNYRANVHYIRVEQKKHENVILHHATVKTKKNKKGKKKQTKLQITFITKWCKP